MSIEVRCGCGQLVYADRGQAGQNVQCPHCKSVVPVPVATAQASRPDPAEARKSEAMSLLGGCVFGLVALWWFSNHLNPSFIKWALLGLALGAAKGLSGIR